MSHPARERLRDIEAVREAIAQYLANDGADDDMVFDAIRVRLIEIGEAAREIDPALLASEPNVPWADISRMRDQLAHRYSDTAHSIVLPTSEHGVPALAADVKRLFERLRREPS